jgi:Ni/Fe-hydrogenase 1 B-type cytochrome subunit
MATVQQAPAVGKHAAQARIPAGAVYVYQAPVRLWHWVMMFAMLTLMVTGYFIGSPLFPTPGEASSQYLMGYIRFVHFAAGYVFAIFFVLRVYWAFVGNQYARQVFLVPLSMFTGQWWRGLIQQTLHYLFLVREVEGVEGHNPLASAAMFFMYVLGTVFMILTGFALYGEGAGMGSWQFKFFSSWVLPLIGDSQKVHTWHHLGMWYLIVFTIGHVYMVVREDIMSDRTIISTMINGWRIRKPF